METNCDILKEKYMIFSNIQNFKNMSQFFFDWLNGGQILNYYDDEGGLSL
jgi:hypothetical protein